MWGLMLGGDPDSRNHCLFSPTMSTYRPFRMLSAHVGNPNPLSQEYCVQNGVDFAMRGEKVMCVYVKVGCEEGLVRWPGIGDRGWPHCVSGWRST